MSLPVSAADNGPETKLDTKSVKSRLQNALLWLGNVTSAEDDGKLDLVRPSLECVVVQTRRAYVASLMLLADDMAACSDWPQVAATARAALAVSPEHARAHYYAGRAHLSAAAHAEAATAFLCAAKHEDASALAAEYKRWAERAAAKEASATGLPTAAGPKTAAPEEGQIDTVMASMDVNGVGSGSGGAGGDAPSEKSDAPYMPPPPPTGPRMEWYQSPQTVVVDVFAKKATKEGTTVRITERRIEVRVKIPGQPDYELDRDLFAAVDPSKSLWSASKYKVELTLMKASSGEWKALSSDSGTSELSATEKARIIGEQKVKAAIKSQKNWDVIAENELEDEKEDESPMALFRTIYKDSDEDTQRAMMKSFQESGGKVLSTDWKDVGSRKVEYNEKD